MGVTATRLVMKSWKRGSSGGVVMMGFDSVSVVLTDFR